MLTEQPTAMEEDMKDDTSQFSGSDDFSMLHTPTIDGSVAQHSTSVTITKSQSVSLVNNHTLGKLNQMGGKLINPSEGSKRDHESKLETDSNGTEQFKGVAIHVQEVVLPEDITRLDKMLKNEKSHM